MKTIDERTAERRHWLARHSRAALRLLESPPPDQRADRFRREVEHVHAALRPIRSRAALVASFSREGALLARPCWAAEASASPIPVAYALRWRELGRGRTPRRGLDDPAA